MSRYLVPYGVSLILGAIVTFLVSELLHARVQRLRNAERDDAAERIWWIPFSLGLVERALITTLVIWDISGTGVFIGLWITVKAAVGWQRWSSGTTFGRAVSIVGLLGSALSALFGVIGGVTVK